MDNDCIFSYKSHNKQENDDSSENYQPFTGKTVFPLPTWLISCGKQCISTPAYNWPGDNRGPSVIWQYTFAGEGFLELNGKTASISAGQAMLVVTPEAHRYFWKENSEPWDFMYLTFEGAAAFTIAKGLRENFGSILDLSASSKSVLFAQEIFEKLKLSAFDSPYLVARAAGDFLYILAEELEQTASRRADEPEFMRRIYRGLQRNPDMDVDALAAISGYSRRYLDRKFKAHTGVSPVEFIRKLRLRKAAWLLENSLSSIKEIASRCGFYDAPYFCREFAAAYGKTPSAYRKRPAGK